MEVVRRIGSVLPVHVHCVARLGAGGTGESNTLPFLPAGSVLPGMHVFLADGGYDVVESVERVAVDRPLYDLDVEHTHNFVADGVVTHNSSTASEAPTSGTSWSSRTTSPTRTWSSSSRTTARRRRSSPPPTRWSRTTGAARARRCGPTSARGIRCGCGSSVDEHAEARFVAAEVAADGRRGRLAERDRGLLPDERAVAGARGHAGAGADRLPGDRRHEVLRPRRDQGRDRLPHLHGQPAGRAARSRGSRTRPSAGSGRRRCRGC